MPLLHVGVGGPQWVDWSIHVDAILLVIALSWGYYYALTELRPRVTDAARVKRRQVVLFALGVLALYIGAGTPLHDLGEQRLLSAHMVQHLVFTLVAPPLLIAGTPAWLWEAILSGRRVFPVARLLTRPLVAFAAFNAAQVFFHLPPLVNAALHIGALHFAIHAILVLTALLMWWPILSPLPQLPRLSYPLQMAYLFIQSIVPAVLASFMTFGTSVIYPFYETAPRTWGIDPLSDQQMAGFVMKIIGSLILWAFMGVAFFKWYAHEESESRGPRWNEVAQELEELGFTRQ